MTTLTYQPDQGQPEFSEEELDSINVGEQMEQEQQQLLAGKYQSAEELEKAYVELQQRFSSGDSDTEPQTEDVEYDDEPTDFNLMDALWEESQSEWSEETLNALKESDPVDIAEAYLELRANQEASHELTSDEISSLQDVVGGEAEYKDMLRWAASNLDQNQIDLFDSVIQKGDPASCYFAVQSLAFRMSEMDGWQSDDFLTGTAPSNPRDAFRSQAEVVQAMSDPRYDTDPAYRQDVMDKLERSDELIY
jgi:hypothetical protein|tara:strand:+ start:69 stop:818 length:750 start_codon:yes stop_codon:yes gene_type:complete